MRRGLGSRGSVGAGRSASMSASTPGEDGGGIYDGSIVPGLLGGGAANVMTDDSLPETLSRPWETPEADCSYIAHRASRSSTGEKGIGLRTLLIITSASSSVGLWEGMGTGTASGTEGGTGVGVVVVCGVGRTVTGAGAAATPSLSSDGALVMG